MLPLYQLPMHLSVSTVADVGVGMRDIVAADAVKVRLGASFEKNEKAQPPPPRNLGRT